MSEFRNYGLKVVVDATEQAQFDFEAWQISPDRRDRIARNLKTTPRSLHDRIDGSFRIREIDGWDITFAFVVNELPTIMIVCVEVAGETEGYIDYMIRAGVTELPSSVQELLKGRRRKSR